MLTTSTALNLKAPCRRRAAGRAPAILFFRLANTIAKPAISSRPKPTSATAGWASKFQAHPPGTKTGQEFLSMSAIPDRETNPPGPRHSNANRRVQSSLRRLFFLQSQSGNDPSNQYNFDRGSQLNPRPAGRSQKIRHESVVSRKIGEFRHVDNRVMNASKISCSWGLSAPPPCSALPAGVLPPRVGRLVRKRPILVGKRRQFMRRDHQSPRRIDMKSKRSRAPSPTVKPGRSSPGHVPSSS